MILCMLCDFVLVVICLSVLCIWLCSVGVKWCYSLSECVRCVVICGLIVLSVSICLV